MSKQKFMLWCGVVFGWAALLWVPPYHHWGLPLEAATQWTMVETISAAALIAGCLLRLFRPAPKRCCWKRPLKEGPGVVILAEGIDWGKRRRLL